jgi:hypothetical protein
MTECLSSRYYNLYLNLYRSGQWSGLDFVGIPYRPLYVYGYKQGNDPILGPYFTYTATNTSLQRFVVTPDGKDVCYMVKQSTQEWEIVWMQPSNECENYGACGSNAICKVLQDGKAKCTCLKGTSSALGAISDKFEFCSYELPVKENLSYFFRKWVNFLPVHTADYKPQLGP